MTGPSLRRPPRIPLALALVAVACGGALSGCFAGTLDKGHLPRARLCFGEPPIPLAVEIPLALDDATGDAPPVLGWLLAQGAARILRASAIFAEVGAPGERLDGSRYRIIRLEGTVERFLYEQDFRVVLAYLPVFLIPVPGAGILLTAVALALGGPICFDEGELRLELRFRDVRTDRLVGQYAGGAEESFRHSLYTISHATGSFWNNPELLLSAALRDALTGVVRDRRTYRRLAAG